MKRNILLIIVEILVMGGIVFGWFAPLLFPSESDETSHKFEPHFALVLISGDFF